MTTLETRAQVGLRPPKLRSAIHGPKGVAAHYNGPAMRMAGKPHSHCRMRWKGVQAYHMDVKGWVDVAYSAAVCHHSVVMEGRGPGVRTAANGTNTSNAQFYAIFFMVGGDEVPSQEMLRAAEWYRENVLKVPEWRKHSDFKSTDCAGKVNDQVKNGQMLFFEDEPGPESQPEPPKPAPEKPAKSWTEQLVENLPVVKRRANLATSNEWDQRVQGLLVAAGVLPLRPNVVGDRLDGKFGPSTETAVKTFQSRHRLAVDGIVGKNTWTKLLGR